MLSVSHNFVFVVLCLPCSKNWHLFLSVTATFCLSFPSRWTEAQGIFNEFPEILHLIWNINPQYIYVYPASLLLCPKTWINSLPKQQQSVTATHHQESVNTMYLVWWCNILSTDKNQNGKGSGSFPWHLHQLKYFWYFITNSIYTCPYSSDVMKTEAKITKYIKPKPLEVRHRSLCTS